MTFLRDRRGTYDHETAKHRSQRCSQDTLSIQLQRNLSLCPGGQREQLAPAGVVDGTGNERCHGLGRNGQSPGALRKRRRTRAAKGPQINPGSRLKIRLKAIMTLLAHIEGRELSVARKT